MKEGTRFLANISGRIGLEPVELIALVALAISVLTLLLVIRRFAKPPTLGSHRAERMGLSVQDVKVKLDDFIGRITNQQTRLEEEVKQLRNDLSDLKRIASTGRRTEESFQSEGEKKKEVVNTHPLPGPIAAKTSIAAGLKNTRSTFLGRLKNIFLKSEASSEAIFSELEELLITSDLGVKATALLLTKLRAEGRRDLLLSEESCKAYLKEWICELVSDSRPIEIIPESRQGRPLVILVVGVNGVGKTTTIGKLAKQFQLQGKKVLLAAGDTFRAAAAEQIQFWGEFAGVPVISGGEGEKPSTVAYRAIQLATSESYDVLIIDTAGRLHTRVNLMNELKALVSLINREHPGAPHETILVVDASTGQNALQQAKDFHQAVTLTGVIVTKLDGTQKGGVIVSIKSELDIPIRYIGIGEGVEDLRTFSAPEFADALFTEEVTDIDQSSKTSFHGKIRRGRRDEIDTAPLVRQRS